MAEHGWSVATVVEPTLGGPGLAGQGVRHYRARCVCDAYFPLQQHEQDALLDGLDHVRLADGRPTRRSEIELEKVAAAEAAARKKALNPQRGRR